MLEIGKSIQPFFGYDPNAKSFFTTNFDGPSIQQSIFTSEFIKNKEEVENSNLYNIMLKSNLNKAVPGLPPTVHVGFTDFVINTALWHRDLDQHLNINFNTQRVLYDVYGHWSKLDPKV